MTRSGRPARDRVERVHGMAAVLAVLSRRPEDVLRIQHTKAARLPLAEALREAASRRIAYNEVTDEELAELSGAAHHEGVCALIRPRSAPTLETLVRRASPNGVVLALDGVDNPHNVGAVLRSVAFFGAAGLLVADPTRKALPPSAVRIAEGGAEHAPVVHVPLLAPALHALRERGLVIVGTDSHDGLPLAALKWPARSVLVLGAERAGMTADVRASCELVTCIEGSGAIESLNVAVAAGVLLAAHAVDRARTPGAVHPRRR
jgi:TrmH RNA methyltransferase